MKNFLKLSIGLSFLSFILGISPVTAAGETLEIHIHKNSLSGDEWTSTAQPIKVTLSEKDGEKIGIGMGASSGLDPEKGPLKPAGEQICSFSWQDSAGQTVTREVKLKKYEQAPAGEFSIPPLRIGESKILLKDTVLANCGGDEAKYQALNQEISALPDNPFRTYQEYLSFPAESLLGKEIIISIGTESEISSVLGEEITGYVCALPEDAPAEQKRGICEQTLQLDPLLARDGVFQVDLVILSTGNTPEEVTPIEEPLLQGANAEFSGPVTMVGNFLIRSAALLDWTLAIDDTGLRNEQITAVYQKSLNIVNGFFILALLTIALLWNFSVLITKERLKRMMILFVIGIIGANFALPVTRLLVDGTNLLQRTLLVKEEGGTAPVQLDDGSPETDSAQSTSKQISASDILSSYDRNIGGFVGLQKSAYVEKNYPQNLGAKIDTEQLNEKSDLYVDRFEEHTWFNLILISLGAFGQFLIALILLFRYIIIWFLLIFSPFLLVLSLFEATRPLLRSWAWLYTRWLLIGPILALTLFIVVSIWSFSGVPLESSYASPSNLVFPNTTNLYVSAPGISSGYLSTPREVMKYIAALMMLYISIFLPFWLTKYIPSGASSFGSKMIQKKKSSIFSKDTERLEHRENSIRTEQSRDEHPAVEVHDAPKEMIASPGNIANGIPTVGGVSETKGNGSMSAFAATPTKDLLNTLQILSTSQPLSNESPLKKTQMNEQRETILNELSTRAKAGDRTAEDAISKVQGTASFSPETSSQNPTITNSNSGTSSENKSPQENEAVRKENPRIFTSEKDISTLLKENGSEKTPNESEDFSDIPPNIYQSRSFEGKTLNNELSVEETPKKP